MKITYTITKDIDTCNECPNFIEGRFNDFCNIADKPLFDDGHSWGKHKIPEWCPFLIDTK
jgi:hypothetical protein